jgi:hypothetical protein
MSFKRSAEKGTLKELKDGRLVAVFGSFELSTKGIHGVKSIRDGKGVGRDGSRNWGCERSLYIYTASLLQRLIRILTRIEILKTPIAPRSIQ